MSEAHTAPTVPVYTHAHTENYLAGDREEKGSAIQFFLSIRLKQDRLQK